MFKIDPAFKAILFDLDGTLIDSMPLHNQAWIEVLSKHGCKITEDTLHKYTGIPNFQTVEIFNQLFGWHLDPFQIKNEKESNFLEKLKFVKVIDSVVEIANQNFEKIPMGIVTGSAPEPAFELIKKLDIQKYFSSIVTAADTDKHKPSPEPFLLGASQLEVDPKGCLVFEDGILGIQAAQAAGMKVIQVKSDTQALSGFKLISLY